MDLQDIPFISFLFLYLQGWTLAVKDCTSVITHLQYFFPAHEGTYQYSGLASNGKIEKHHVTYKYDRFNLKNIYSYEIQHYSFSHYS